MTCWICRQLLTIFLCFESTTYPRVTSESASFTWLNNQSLRLSDARNDAVSPEMCSRLVGSELCVQLSSALS